MTNATFGLRFRRFCRCTGLKFAPSATVAEALAEITTHPFDILISDLNIGEPGDGFTVVSAMRRTQPNCVNLILTGFPAFESALAAIQSQVDGYLMKPANLGTGHVDSGEVAGTAAAHSVTCCGSRTCCASEWMRLATTLSKMKSDPVLSTIAMSDERARQLSARLGARDR